MQQVLAVLKTAPVFLVKMLLASSAIWLPVALVFILWQVWLYYLRVKYLHELEWVLLEIKMPREIAKSPAGMEVVLAAFHQTAEGTFIDRFLKGRVRAWFSLEMASFGGEIHFFIRAEKKHKNLIESQIYSQYPEVEIYEVADYTGQVSYGRPASDWELFGIEFQLTKEDPYPIKTYIDYGLDKEKEEPRSQIDPLTPIIEMMGSIKSGEQLWWQILIMATRDRKKKPDSWFGREGWKEEGQRLIDEILQRNPKTKGPKEKNPETGFPVLPRISKAEEVIIEAIGRNIAKLGFDCGMRAIYLAKEAVFDKVNIGGILGSIKQFNSLDLNGFKPGPFKTHFEYPWQDFRGLRLARRKRIIFDAYRRRSYFYMPYSAKAFVLNSEELATIFHFPGLVAETPTFPRIESKRAEPPVNLPV